MLCIVYKCLLHNIHINAMFNRFFINTRCKFVYHVPWIVKFLFIYLYTYKKSYIYFLFNTFNLFVVYVDIYIKIKWIYCNIFAHAWVIIVMGTGSRCQCPCNRLYLVHRWYITSPRYALLFWRTIRKIMKNKKSHLIFLF